MDHKDLQAGQTEENFWFKAKRDLVGILMKKACANGKRLRILNVGAGTGGDLKILNEFGDNYVIDIDDNALAVIEDGLCVEKKIADACDLPYGDGYFDAAVSFDVFEHIEDDRKAIGEIRRVLKENGALIFTVPAFQSLFSSHDKALQHQRRYNKKEIKRLLSPFSDLKIFFWNSLMFFPMAAARLAKKKSKPKIEKINLPPRLNVLFFKLLSVDNFLIKNSVCMPLGSSIAGFCYKRK